MWLFLLLFYSFLSTFLSICLSLSKSRHTHIYLQVIPYVSTLVNLLPPLMVIPLLCWYSVLSCKGGREISRCSVGGGGSARGNRFPVSVETLRFEMRLPLLLCVVKPGGGGGGFCMYVCCGN